MWWWPAVAEIVGWFLGVVGTVAGMGLLWLMRWRRRMAQEMREMRREMDTLKATAVTANETREVRREMDRLRLELAKEYISRADWIPVASKVLGMLEEHSSTLSRLDERTKERASP